MNPILKFCGWQEKRDRGLKFEKWKDIYPFSSLWQFHIHNSHIFCIMEQWIWEKSSKYIIFRQISKCKLSLLSTKHRLIGTQNDPQDARNQLHKVSFKYLLIWQRSPRAENGPISQIASYLRASEHPLEIIQKIWKNSGIVFSSKRSTKKKVGSMHSFFQNHGAFDAP